MAQRSGRARGGASAAGWAHMWAAAPGRPSSAAHLVACTPAHPAPAPARPAPCSYLSWLKWLYFLSFIKLGISLVKYIPQVRGKVSSARYDSRCVLCAAHRSTQKGPCARVQLERGYDEPFFECIDAPESWARTKNMAPWHLTLSPEPRSFSPPGGAQLPPLRTPLAPFLWCGIGVVLLTLTPLPLPGGAQLPPQVDRGVEHLERAAGL